MDERALRDWIGRVEAGSFIRMNRLVQNVVVIPLIWRSWVSGVAGKLRGTDVRGRDSSCRNLARWHKDA